MLQRRDAQPGHHPHRVVTSVVLEISDTDVIFSTLSETISSL